MFHNYIVPMVEIIGMIIEYIGIGLVVASIFIALVKLPRKRFTMENVRAELAKRIMFGLEFIIAADIILVTMASSFNKILQLGGIVIIRVLLGYALRKEVMED